MKSTPIDPDHLDRLEEIVGPKGIRRAKDLTGLDKDPYLFAGRIGTPSDQNTVLGVSALYGEVIDDHGAHRVDEGDPLGGVRQELNIVRRWRVGLDGTHLIDQWTLRGEISGGEDFEQTVINAVGEIEWTSSDERFMAYLQARYNGQNGHLGWSDDVQSRLGLRVAIPRHAAQILR